MEHRPASTMTKKIIAIVNQKGGVGKTTTAINLGASLASADMRTLLIDLDPQANATSGLGFPKAQIALSTYDVVVRGRPLSDVVLPTEMECLWLAPASRALVSATMDLAAEPDRDIRLRAAIEHADSYDFILIDCPPSLDILTVNALIASQSVLVPIQSEYFALEGVSELLETIRSIRRARNPGLRIEGVLLTMYDDRTNLSRQVTEDLRAHFGSQVFQTVVPRNVRLGEAPSHGKPIILYDIKSKGAESYIRLAKEIIGGQ